MHAATQVYFTFEIDGRVIFACDAILIAYGADGNMLIGLLNRSRLQLLTLKLLIPKLFAG